MFSFRALCLALATTLLAACGSEDPDAAGAGTQAVIEDVNACTGTFVCSSKHHGGYEYYLSDNGKYGCGFFTSEGTRHQVLRPDGITESGDWHQTERGFVIEYSETIKTTCVAKSKYIPGEKLDDGKDPGDGEQSNCRRSGHFCAASSVCCSYSCSVSTNTCN